MGYKTKSMLHQIAKAQKGAYSNPRKTTSGGVQNTVSQGSSISGLGNLLGSALKDGGRSMKNFDKRIDEKIEDGNFKRAARLEKKQAAFQRRKERSSARYAERKGTEPIFSTDKEDLTPSNRRLMNKLEGTKLGDSKIVKGLEKTGLLDLRENRVSNEERKKQIARRVKENRLKRSKTDYTEDPADIEINRTADYVEGTDQANNQNNTSTPKANNIVTEELNTASDESLFGRINRVFDIESTAVENMKESLNTYPGIGDAFNKANSRKNK